MQGNCIEGMLGGLNRCYELIGVHATRCQAAFPVDGRLDEGVGLTAWWNSDLIVEQLRDMQSKLCFDAPQRLHERIIPTVSGRGRLDLFGAIPHQDAGSGTQSPVTNDRVILDLEHS